MEAETPPLPMVDALPSSAVHSSQLGISMTVCRSVLKATDEPFARRLMGADVTSSSSSSTNLSSEFGERPDFVPEIQLIMRSEQTAIDTIHATKKTQHKMMMSTSEMSGSIERARTDDPE